MKRCFILGLSGICLVLLCSSWGFFAHYRIGRLAVFTLPKAMAGFYKNNIDYLTRHAVSADKRGMLTRPRLQGIFLMPTTTAKSLLLPYLKSGRPRPQNTLPIR
jgi:hypothetical protein